MRKVSKADYYHLEFCHGQLIADFDMPAEKAYQIGDFFWNAEEASDGQFSIRLHEEDIAFRVPRRLRAQLAANRLAAFAQIERPWAIVCRCGRLTLTTTGVMVRSIEESPSSLVYVHFSPGFNTDGPVLEE